MGGYGWSGLLLGLLFGSQALAASGLHDARGTVAPLGFDIQGKPLPSAQVPQLRGRLEQLLEQVRGTAALAPLRGFAINQSVRLFEQPAALHGAPAGGRAHLLVRRVDPVRSERDPSGGLRGVGEGPAIELRVNDQAALFGDAVGKDADGDYFQLAVKPRRLQGMPVLQVGSKDVVVVHKPGRKPFTHITRQRYLEGLIAGEHEHIALLQHQLAQATDADSRQQLQPFIRQWQASVAQKRAQLAGMSEAERRSPTCQSSAAPGLFTACDEAGAVYYVTFAPGYFQPGLPPSSVQLLTISVVNKGFLNDRELGLKLRQAVAQLDLPALQRSLD